MKYVKGAQGAIVTLAIFMTACAVLLWTFKPFIPFLVIAGFVIFIARMMMGRYY